MMDGMGGMADMMSKMMGGSAKPGMPMMDMMSEMMPQGLSMMLSQLPKEQRVEFAKSLIETVVAKTCEGLTKEEREAFFADISLEDRPDEDAE
jgi:tRNA A37 threonylcarbamoyltransferase TsaD